MDVKEFEKIVTPNYQEAIANPTDLRRTYNPVITMNTMAEFLALHKMDYVGDLPEKQLTDEATAIRKEHPALGKVKYQADLMKHVRKLRGTNKKVSSTLSSTEFTVEDPKSWEHLRPVLDDAMAVLRPLVTAC